LKKLDTISKLNTEKHQQRGKTWYNNGKMSSALPIPHRYLALALRTTG